MTDREFTQLLHELSGELYRDMPWRRDTRGYYVLVSEIMLQQTQVDRVVPKFEAFVARFPDFETLARAPLADVLTLWSGLGYNRRAKFLHEAARAIVDYHGGVLPATHDELVTLPGVGRNTAGALLAYVYNQPVLYVETNVRTVYLHHFFADRRDVTDSSILERLEATLWRDHPREFYWALMDYGSWLKRSGVRNVSASKHYRKQSPLAGSVREVRGAIVRQLTGGEISLGELRACVDPGDGRFDSAYGQLIAERLIEQYDDQVRLTN
ncbi:A/G-specific adenine glycosylase [Candidatus Mycosynbacter amalyticus]|uniref:Adenine DNA glycosylase n=1 Tax=Candidatus Mycosynbacter amalyticus TaxID=2665156 RepID=A0A857ML06_9BACT|nr:A/G-specific adenine glycosylase [Candidatus Mycosynbacter amalyticus]QHN43253.1 A/G-specific adenine glycosylase [Candidatus Mycosynbacter amalyticus]